MRNDKRTKGFSLIEIVIALVIMSVTFTGLIMHIMSTRRGAESTVEEMKGIAIAADMSDRIKNMLYDKIPLLNNSDDSNTFSSLSIPADGSEMAMVAPPFKRFVSISEINETFNADGKISQKYPMKKVTVEVNWDVTTINDKNQKVTRNVSIKVCSLIRKMVY